MAIKRDILEFANFYVRFLYDDKLQIFIIIFCGSLDKEPILEFREKIKDNLLTKQFNFIVDLNHVTYISSAGLGFLMYLSKYKKNFIFLSYPPETIQKPFKLLEMDEFFQFYSNPEELKMRVNIPDNIIQVINDETAILTIQYDRRWLNILRRHYLTYEEVMKEIERMKPYIRQADHADSITLPSEDKYVCVLYKFLDRIFNKIAKISREEIDDALVELIAKELMANAVTHGYDNRKEGVVEVNFKIDNEKLEINMIDYGKGIFTSKPSHDLFPSAGLKLLRKIFDDVDISKAPKKRVQGLVLGKGTMVKMTKYLKPKHLRTQKV